MDKRGQFALEYLLIFFILLIILSAISIPLLHESIESTNDLTDSVKVKSLLTEIQKNVKFIYSLDVDSRRTISVYVPKDMVLYHTVRGDKHYLYTTLTLSDGTKKRIEVEMPCKVSFNNNSNHYYSSLNNRWYYNVEVKWIESGDGEKSINVIFK